VFGYLWYCSPITKVVCKNWNLQPRVSSKHAIIGSVKRGDIISLEWLLKNIKTEIDLFDSALEFGQVRVLQWLKDTGRHQIFVTQKDYKRSHSSEQRIQYDCSKAAGNGHLDVLQWLKENGWPWDSWTCILAASGGHLKVLKWSRENGCPWNHVACQEAAREGHLNILKWLRENKCPWDRDQCLEMSRREGRDDVANWILNQG
jgi:hypothetical protein